MREQHLFGSACVWPASHLTLLATRRGLGCVFNLVMGIEARDAPCTFSLVCWDDGDSADARTTSVVAQLV